MKAWLIIDGYNLLHQLDRDLLSGLENKRSRLWKLLEPLVGVLAEKITVVFDGKNGMEFGGENSSKIVEVIYSPSDKSADSVIENLVWNYAHPGKILVVTSDRYERDSVTARGADTMASSVFISNIREVYNRLDSQISAYNKGNKSITLADFFPESGT